MIIQWNEYKKVIENSSGLRPDVLETFTMSQSKDLGFDAQRGLWRYLAESTGRG